MFATRLEEPMALPADLGAQPLDPDDLDAELDGFERGDYPQPWRPDDLPAAEWVMRKAAEAQAQLAEADAEAQRMHADVDGWWKRATREPARTVRWAEQLLTDHLRRLQADARAQGKRVPASLPLASGEVWSRTPKKPQVVIEDPDAVDGWVRARARESLTLALGQFLARDAAGTVAEAALAQLGADKVLRLRVELDKRAFDAEAEVKEADGGVPEGWEEGDPMPAPVLYVVVEGEQVPGVGARRPADAASYGIRPGGTG